MLGGLNRRFSRKDPPVAPRPRRGCSTPSPSETESPRSQGPCRRQAEARPARMSPPPARTTASAVRAPPGCEQEETAASQAALTLTAAANKGQHLRDQPEHAAGNGLSDGTGVGPPLVPWNVRRKTKSFWGRGEHGVGRSSRGGHSSHLRNRNGPLRTSHRRVCVPHRSSQGARGSGEGLATSSGRLWPGAGEPGAWPRRHRAACCAGPAGARCLVRTINPRGLETKPACQSSEVPLAFLLGRECEEPSLLGRL